MAIVANGLLSEVAWTNNTALVSSGADSMAFQYIEDGSPTDVTVLGARTQQMHGTLRSATATLTTRIEGVEIGNAAGVAVASSGYYAAHIRQWQLSMGVRANETTEQNTSSPPTWRTFEPGLATISGSYEARPSDSVSFTGANGAGTTTRAVTLTLRGSNTFAGDAIVSRANMDLNPGDAFVTMNFEGAGDWAKTGSTFIAAGTIGAKSGDVGFATGTLTLTYTTGMTISGSAFPTNISITAPVDGVLTVQTQVQFTGAVTHS